MKVAAEHVHFRPFATQAIHRQYTAFDHGGLHRPNPLTLAAQQMGCATGHQQDVALLQRHVLAARQFGAASSANDDVVRRHAEILRGVFQRPVTLELAT